MAIRRMISRGLSTSKKIHKLFRKHPDDPLALLATNLYAFGIPHADDLGQYKRDPFDWKALIYPHPELQEDEYDQAIKMLIAVNLFELSACGKVIRYVQFHNINPLRGDGRTPTEYFKKLKWAGTTQRG